MLNPFPDLLTYSMLAPFLLRLVAGIIFVDLGVLMFKGEKERWISSLTTIGVPNPAKIVKIIGILEIICGIMLIVGFYTQISALILSLLTLKEIYIEYRDPSILKRTLVFFILIFTITTSLLFSGAGAFAIDLPL